MTIERTYPHLSFPELILWQENIQPAPDAWEAPLHSLSSGTLRLIILQHTDPTLRGQKTPVVTDELLVATSDILLQRIKQRHTETMRMLDIDMLKRLAKFIIQSMCPTPPPQEHIRTS